MKNVLIAIGCCFCLFCFAYVMTSKVQEATIDKSLAPRVSKAEKRLQVPIRIDTASLRGRKKASFCVKVTNPLPDFYMIEFSDDDWISSNQLNSMELAYSFSYPIPKGFRSEKEAIRYAKKFKNYNQMFTLNEKINKITFAARKKQAEQERREREQNNFTPKETIVICDEKK